jgi:hypothetical protein
MRVRFEFGGQPAWTSTVSGGGVRMLELCGAGAGAGQGIPEGMLQGMGHF